MWFSQPYGPETAVVPDKTIPGRQFRHHAILDLQEKPDAEPIRRNAELQDCARKRQLLEHGLHPSQPNALYFNFSRSATIQS